MLLAGGCSAGGSLRGHAARSSGTNAGIGSCGFVRGSCCAAQAGRRCLAGERRPRKRIVVKPSSERSEGSRAKSIGSSGGVERRRTKASPSGGLVGGGALVRGKASPFTGRRWKRARRKRRTESRKGTSDEVEATGRQRFGRAKQAQGRQNPTVDTVRRSGAFRRERNARPRSRGIFRGPRVNR